MKNVCNFVFELGQLKRIKHEGWRLIGDDNPESVAEHSLRAAQIGYILSKLEGYEKPERICSILIFHDIAECRIGDIHKVANRYVESNEKEAVKDQLGGLEVIGEDIMDLWSQAYKSDTEAGIITKDADLLEMAFTAREYIERGFISAGKWIKKISERLQTESAKKLLVSLKNSNPNDWWKDLKRV